MRDFDSSFSIDDTSLNVKERMWNSKLKMEGFTQFRVKFHYSRLISPMMNLGFSGSFKSAILSEELGYNKVGKDSD